MFTFQLADILLSKCSLKEEDGTIIYADNVSTYIRKVAPDICSLYKNLLPDSPVAPTIQPRHFQSGRLIDFLAHLSYAQGELL